MYSEMKKNIENSDIPISSPTMFAPVSVRSRKIVNGTMRKNGFARHALIETLHTVQSSFGYLDDDAIRFVARSLRVPLSQAYGVVTFYHYFSLKPPGKHTMTICTGTACYIKGGPKVLAAALDAVACAKARGVSGRSDVLTVIDYSLPSTQPRPVYAGYSAPSIRSQPSLNPIT